MLLHIIKIFNNDVGVSMKNLIRLQKEFFSHCPNNKVLWALVNEFIPEKGKYFRQSQISSPTFANVIQLSPPRRPKVTTAPSRAESKYGFARNKDAPLRDP